MELTGAIPSKHLLIGRKTNHPGGQLILGNSVKFFEKIERPIDITSCAGAVGLHRQHTASYRGGGIFSVLSGAIDNRSHLLELPGPRVDNMKPAAGLNKPYVIAQRVEERQRALILVNGFLI